MVAGSSYDGESFKMLLLRLDVNGAPDTGFGEEGLFTFNGVADSEDRAHGIALQSDGKIIVAGYSHSGEDDDCLTFRVR